MSRSISESYLMSRRQHEFTVKSRTMCRGRTKSNAIMHSTFRLDADSSEDYSTYKLPDSGANVDAGVHDGAPVENKER